MTLLSLILLAVALSMDCFALCVVHGAQRSAFRSCLKPGEKDPFYPLHKDILRMGFIFALFHVIMIALGWFLGYGFLHYIDLFDHWIAFGLLAGIGVKMIWESFGSQKIRTQVHALLEWRTLLLLGLATSIDAFAVGISLSLSQTSLLSTCLIVPLVLMFFTALGVLLGYRIKKISIRAITLLGGLILLGIGLRILLEHEYGFI